MDDDTVYLQWNFDPKTLRVADLRRILIFHDIDFPSLAKKSQLVNLFLENITPEAETLLWQKQNIRPSNKGIEYVTEVIRLPPQKRRFPRKSKGIEIVTDENGDVQPQIFLPGVLGQIFLLLRS